MKVDEGRKQRGEEIAKSGKMKQEGNHWIVPSQSGHGNYIVSMMGREPICTCPDFESRNVRCKHIIAVELTIAHNQNPEEIIAVEGVRKVTYSQA